MLGKTDRGEPVEPQACAERCPSFDKLRTNGVDALGMIGVSLNTEPGTIKL
jgi:hypothetical protein